LKLKKKGQLSIELTLFVHENSLTNLVWKLGRRIGSEHGTVVFSPVCVCVASWRLLFIPTIQKTRNVYCDTHTHTQPTWLINWIRRTTTLLMHCVDTHTHTQHKSGKKSSSYTPYPSWAIHPRNYNNKTDKKENFFLAVWHD
jgi:hypothetical protein